METVELIPRAWEDQQNSCLWEAQQPARFPAMSLSGTVWFLDLLQLRTFMKCTTHKTPGWTRCPLDQNILTKLMWRMGAWGNDRDAGMTQVGRRETNGFYSVEAGREGHTLGYRWSEEKTKSKLSSDRDQWKVKEKANGNTAGIKLYLHWMGEKERTIHKQREFLKIEV